MLVGMAAAAAVLLAALQLVSESDEPQPAAQPRDSPAQSDIFEPREPTRAAPAPPSKQPAKVATPEAKPRTRARTDSPKGPPGPVPKAQLGRQNTRLRLAIVLDDCGRDLALMRRCQGEPG